MNPLWQPASACDPSCLVDDEPFVAVSPLRRVGRLAALVAVLLGAAALLPVLPALPAARRNRMVRACARGVLRALGMRVTHRGALPVRSGGPAGGAAAARPGCGTGVLVAANHISWLDIVVLLAGTRTRLVAKSEVRGWPVIGRIARYAGTIFVDRARPTALPVVVAEVRRALAAGDVVAVFPEGTTSCGRDIGRFRAAFFQAAVDAGAPVVPVTLRYRLAGAGQTSATAFLGEETLLVSLRRILRLPRPRAGLTCGSAIHPAPGATRRTLARVAAAAVGAAGPAGDGYLHPTVERPVRAPIPAPAAPSLVRDQRSAPDSRTTPVALRPAA